MPCANDDEKTEWCKYEKREKAKIELFEYCTHTQQLQQHALVFFLCSKLWRMNVNEQYTQINETLSLTLTYSQTSQLIYEMNKYDGSDLKSNGSAMKIEWAFCPHSLFTWRAEQIENMNK